MIEAMLFTSGRPIVIVPPDWERGARLEKVVIAWYGSGRAARAVGDAMPMLTRAEQVEIVYVSPGALKSIPSTGLSARDCKKVTVAELPMEHGGIADPSEPMRRWREQICWRWVPMPILLEIVIGGVTTDMLAEAELRVFLSH